MSYWDTSTLVKLYLLEPDTPQFEQYILNFPGPIVTSRLSLYEARATFRRKESDGALKPNTAEQLYTQLLNDVTTGDVRLIELGAHLESQYAEVLNLSYQQTPPIPLRTLDALQLASVKAAGETVLVTTDNRMRQAGKSLGLTLFPT